MRSRNDRRSRTHRTQFDHHAVLTNTAYARSTRRKRDLAATVARSSLPANVRATSRSMMSMLLAAVELCCPAVADEASAAAMWQYRSRKISRSRSGRVPAAGFDSKIHKRLSLPFTDARLDRSNAIRFNNELEVEGAELGPPPMAWANAKAPAATTPAATNAPPSAAPGMDFAGIFDRQQRHRDCVAVREQYETRQRSSNLVASLRGQSGNAVRKFAHRVMSSESWHTIRHHPIKKHKIWSKLVVPVLICNHSIRRLFLLGACAGVESADFIRPLTKLMRRHLPRLSSPSRTSLSSTVLRVATMATDVPTVIDHAAARYQPVNLSYPGVTKVSCRPSSRVATARHQQGARSWSSTNASLACSSVDVNGGFHVYICSRCCFINGTLVVDVVIQRRCVFGCRFTSGDKGCRHMMAIKIRSDVQVHELPPVFAIHNFLTPEECRILIETGGAGLKRSIVVDGKVRIQSSLKLAGVHADVISIWLPHPRLQCLRRPVRALLQAARLNRATFKRTEQRGSLIRFTP